MLKIRLRRMGRRKRPFYRVVVSEATSPRDGRFVEEIGIYDPLTEPETVRIDVERALYWLEHGAQPTETARSLLRKAGVLKAYHERRKARKAEVQGTQG
ncbi:MAG: SSU ribosomal protein S16p [Brockia lithotrophica]|uniref:Small ribosomal subunit protein bS16 n=1 Tax=Brockia lithotrophica TaxID=933949 RepID=A0A2T5G922_9BACL|nr:30S ribosomal protein S16 [Brockia lithotrophica]PTQ52692.1 MAG: SSU ribosomal protein S16p [Brockia lithotrophica]